MRIGVDAACWANGRGYGRFTRELLRAMIAAAPNDEFIFFADDASRRQIECEGVNARIVPVRQGATPTEAAAASGYRSPADLLHFSRAVLREPLDVFFSPSIYTYFPLPPRLAAVVTVHDAIADRFPDLTLPTWRARLFWRLKVFLALRQARLILTVSEFAAGELVDVLGLARSRIRVATEAPAPAYRPSDDTLDIETAVTALGLPAGSRWFAYVGGFSPHKRVEDAVRAHAKVVRGCVDHPPYLLLVGALQGDCFLTDQQRIHEAIDSAGTHAYVKWTGFVPDEKLRHVLSGALGLLLPSACEGFGLPAVEAAACGTPVIATTASPLPQLLDGGGIFVEPGNVDGLTAAMRELLDQPRRDALGARARERASQLSWARSAAATLAALREAAA